MRGIMFLAAILIGLGTVMAQVADRMTTVRTGLITCAPHHHVTGCRP